MVILTDADDVLEDLTRHWVEYLNLKFGTNVKYEDLTDWDMLDSFSTLTKEQIYSVETDEALYLNVKPLDGAVEYLKRLIDDGHTVYVVTATPYQIVKFKMENVIFKYFPFLSWDNVIITFRKQLIKGDVLIDDGVHNLVGGDYRKILMTAPYNKVFNAEANGIVRVRNWKEIYEVISRWEAI